MAKNVSSTIVLKVSDKEVVNSFNGIRREVIRLEKGLKKLTPGTEEFMKKAAELKEARSHFERVKNEIDQVNGRLKKSEGFLGKYRNILANIGIGFTEIVSGFIAINFNKTFSELLKISDAMADVQKTTGMALEEVKGLWDAFDEMDTRTSKLDRLKIAEVGGRLGVPKEQMASFVQEVDKAYVALGDSFQGGLENVVDSLGKIKGLFNETKGKTYAEAINEVGSALNELAASGTASEGNISDFALRVGALPDALKPSIDKVLGLGAAFEESGVDSQIAASGYSNFIKVAGENLQNFAYSMNMSYEEAQKLFNEKPEEFFLRFAQGMRDVPAEQTAKIFDSLKIGTLEVQKAVGAAANRTEEFREAMARAGVAMQDATSLNDEFNKKNNNAAAIVEKLKNAFTDLLSSTNIINMFEGLIKAIGWLTGVTNEAGNEVVVFKNRLTAFFKLLGIITVSVVSYKTAVYLLALTTKNAVQQTIIYNAITKAKAAIDTIAHGTTLLLAAAKLRLQGNTVRATAAMRAFNIAVKANPVGLIISVIITAAAALYTYSGNAEKATNASKKMREEFANAGKAAGEEIVKLKLLYKAATDHKKSIDERKEAIRQLKEQYPSYFGNIKDEIIMNGKAESSYRSLRAAIISSARAKAASKVLEDRETKRLERDEKLEEEINKETAKRNKLKANKNLSTTISYEAEGRTYDYEVKNDKLLNASRGRLAKLEEIREANRKADEKEDAFLIKTIEKNEKEAEKYNRDKEDRLNSELKNIIAPTSGNGGKVKTNRPANNKAADEAKKKAEEEKRDLEDSKKRRETAEKEVIKLSQELEEEKLKIKQTTQEKEIEDAELARQKELTAQKEHGEEILNNIKELEEKIKNAKSDEAKKNYTEALAKEREASFANDLLIAQAEETHQKKLAAIREKYRLQEHRKNIEAKQVQMEKDWQAKETEIQNITTLEEAKKKLSEMKHLELTATELRNIKTLEDAKKALRENAAREMLEAEIKAIEEQKAKLNELLKDPTLSPEALEQLRKDLNEVDSVIVRLKGTLQGKKEEDAAKKVTEQQDRRKNVDILGFSAAEWEEMWKNLNSTEGIIKGVSMSIQSMANAFQRFSQLQQALNEKEMRKFSENQEKKKKALLVQLNQGLISQEQYQKGIQSLEDETAEKKRQIQRRAAKAEKAANIANAISGTAMAVVNALYSAPWPFNLVLAGIVGAMGAAQIATIAAQPIPEFAQGGYTGNGIGNPDRTGFRPTGIVHEGEYVTPKWMLQNPVVADVVEWMESIRTGRISQPRGYADGGLASAKPETIASKPLANIEPASNDNAQLVMVLNELKELVTDLKNKGVEAWMVEDAENGRRIKRTIKMFEKIETKNARR